MGHLFILQSNVLINEIKVKNQIYKINLYERPLVCASVCTSVCVSHYYIRKWVCGTTNTGYTGKVMEGSSTKYFMGDIIVLIIIKYYLFNYFC